ncbi:hypothetical protein [Altericista sp. CCNU0014]|uniref:hypothetical protein n=1 Tax=Altericista sp. CCNU0014 TaxID=3082949 RepID=UPI00384F3426
MGNSLGSITQKQSKKTTQIKNSTLILISFATAFFPRFFSSFGAPSAINFAHFCIIPFCFIVVAQTTKTCDRKRIKAVWQVLGGMSILLACTIISALLNNAGMVNVFLQFMFQAEAFMLLAAIILIPLAGKKLENFKNWLFGFAFFNFLLAAIQSVLLPIGIYPKPKGGTIQDNITGVFGGGGGSAANYVSCTVSFYIALYFFNSTKHLPIWIRILPLLGSLYQIQVSDSKQVFLALILGYGLLLITKVKYPIKLLCYITLGIIFTLVFSWVLQNVESEFLSPYQNWTRRSIWGWDGLVVQTKFAAFRIVLSHYETPFNFFFGLGPGHTVTRLGGWVFRDYAQLLMPLGATVHPVSSQVFDVVRSTYLTQESTVYFPLFTWAGIWGDLGFVGLGAYLYLSSIVWRVICVDDFSKFLILSTAVFGFILTQMEEPGHILSVACLIALRWQEEQERRAFFNAAPL